MDIAGSTDYRQAAEEALRLARDLEARLREVEDDPRTAVAETIDRLAPLTEALGSLALGQAAPAVEVGDGPTPGDGPGREMARGITPLRRGPSQRRSPEGTEDREDGGASSAPRDSPGGEGGVAFLLAQLRAVPRAARQNASTLAAVLGEAILNAVHRGRLDSGARLPSIRELSQVLGTSKRNVVRAYALLERERIVESRARSGMYVAPLHKPGGNPPGETGEWLAEVLATASDHQIRIPLLPDLIERSTRTAKIRCACVESDEDSITALCWEVEHHFGLESVRVDIGEIIRTSAEAAEPPRTIAAADVLVTTPFHAPLVRRWADRLERPLAVAPMRPDVVSAIERKLRDGGLTIVCSDPRFGDRIKRMFAPDRKETVQVVLPDDVDGIAAIQDEPVLLTRAARERMDACALRLLVPISPTCPPGFSRQLTRVLLHHNLGGRHTG